MHDLWTAWLWVVHSLCKQSRKQSRRPPGNKANWPQGQWNCLLVYSPQKGAVRLYMYYRSFRMASGTDVPVIIQGCHLVFLHACANHICTWLSMVSIWIILMPVSPFLQCCCLSTRFVNIVFQKWVQNLLSSCCYPTLFRLSGSVSQSVCQLSAVTANRSTSFHSEQLMKTQVYQQFCTK